MPDGPKVFLLDPEREIGSSTSSVPSYLLMGAQMAGWTICRPQILKQGRGTEWLADVRSKLDEADIIVGLGNFISLMQAGNELDGLLNNIGRKIASGCPALLQGCSSLFTNAFPALESQIRGLLAPFGIQITPARVASAIYEFGGHSSQSCCVFRQDDDSLLDARLFVGVDTVSAYGSRLIHYDSNVFPLIEASRLHFFVGDGDLRIVGNLGKRNAIAVRYGHDGKCLIVFTGNLLNDPAETLGGHLPSVEDNKLLAEHLIRDLTGHVRRPTDYGQDAYVMFRELEGKLGELIERVLTRISGNRDFSPMLPEDIQRKLRTGDGRVDYSFAMFLQLVLILKQLWPRFEAYFLSDTGRPLARDAVMAPLFAVNEQRKFLAHPHKARQQGWQMGADDMKTLQEALQLVRLAAARFQ
jgi:hypothetical protein